MRTLHWLFTRIWDWLTYRSPTDEQIAERVARSVANARYESWHAPEEHVGPPPVSHLRHSFTELAYDGDEWIREQAQKRHTERALAAPPPPPKPTKRFIYGDNWNAYQDLGEDGN